MFILVWFDPNLSEPNRKEKLVYFDDPNRNRNRTEMHEIFSSVRFDSYLGSVFRFGFDTLTGLDAGLTWHGPRGSGSQKTVKASKRNRLI